MWMYVWGRMLSGSFQSRIEPLYTVWNGAGVANCMQIQLTTTRGWITRTAVSAHEDTGHRVSWHGRSCECGSHNYDDGKCYTTIHCSARQGSNVQLLVSVDLTCLARCSGRTDGLRNDAGGL
ncbi:hypothetical protein BV22DRAFT_37983 [Leucogyrophana mollusca]|uniref:Uncharacterized protein n=1 Tax=Leucogyrophana mollusca TaxID=85980 RepID=A0ACB8BZA1_9AGAM|nr:hypothetical protein BV22DRAFT_37983 [Leucogyrophana mollusca]